MINLPFFQNRSILSSTWKPAAHLAWTEKEDQVAVVDSQEGKVYQFNGTGAFIWTSLCRNFSGEQISKLIAEKFESPLEKIQKDTQQFLSELRSQDLIEPVEKNDAH